MDRNGLHGLRWRPAIWQSRLSADKPMPLGDAVDPVERNIDRSPLPPLPPAPEFGLPFRLDLAILSPFTVIS